MSHHNHQTEVPNYKNYADGGIAFVGCITIGVGIGILTGNWMHFAAAATIGTGIGFLALAKL